GYGCHESIGTCRASNCATRVRQEEQRPAYGTAGHSCCAHALALRSNVDPPGQAMVARPQLLSWFLRTPLLCLRGLAGTLAPGQDSAKAFVDRCWDRGAGVGLPCRWTNRRRAFSGTVLATPARMWLDRAVFRVELSSRTSFSHSLSCVDDPHPHHRFQPD